MCQLAPPPDNVAPPAVHGCDGRNTAVTVPRYAGAANSGTASREKGTCDGNPQNCNAFGSTLVFTCGVGYISSNGAGTVTMVCGQNGLFTVNGACEPVTCDGSAISGDANSAAQAGGTGATAPGQAYRSTLVFPCKQPAAYGSGTMYTCGQGGIFEPSNDNQHTGCTERTCNEGSSGPVVCGTGSKCCPNVVSQRAGR